MPGITDPMIQNLFNMAMQTRASGANQSAIMQLTNIISLCPEHHGAFNERGLAKNAIDDVEGAIEDFQKAIALAPAKCVAAANLGDLYRVRGQFNKAEEFLVKAIAMEPHGVPHLIYHFLADVKYELRKYPEAINLYNEYLKKNPESFSALNARGYVKFLAGQYEEALKDTDDALKLNPNFVAALNNRGLAYKELGYKAKDPEKYKLAKADYQKAISIQEDYLPAWVHLGEVCSYLKEFGEAEKAFNRAAELNPQLSLIYHLRGQVHVALGNDKKAWEDFNKEIELKSPYPDAYFRRAKAKLKLGEDPSVFQDLVKARYLGVKFTTETPLFRNDEESLFTASQVFFSLQNSNALTEWSKTAQATDGNTYSMVIPDQNIAVRLSNFLMENGFVNSIHQGENMEQIIDVKIPGNN